MKSNRKTGNKRTHKKKIAEPAKEENRQSLEEFHEEKILTSEKQIINEMNVVQGTVMDEQVKEKRTYHMEDLQKETVSECQMLITDELNVGQGTNIEGSRIWSELPIDLVESIALHLYRIDFNHVTCVCKRWRSIGPYSLFMKRHAMTLSNPDAPLLKNHSPWLMFSQKGDSMYTFWDPLYDESCVINVPQLLDSRLCFCKDGWVFMASGNGSMSLFNPFIMEEIKLPNFQDLYCLDTVGISVTPTLRDSIICIFTRRLNESIGAYICGHEDLQWIGDTYESNLPFILSYANPIFMDNVFYVLGHDGKLGIFDPYQRTWKVLAKPKSLKFCNCTLFTACRWENYLVEWRGKLLMVLVDFPGTQIHVYQLDSSLMQWVEVKALEDCTLFIGRWNSFSCRAVVERMANKIYFSLRSGTDCIYFSLEDQRCYPTPDFYDSEEFLNCTWVEPRWFKPSAEELTWS